jgi:hypothetical protein
MARPPSQTPGDIEAQHHGGTEIPTSTPRPSPSPFSTPSGTGPYLAYLRSQNGQRALTFLEPSSTGRHVYSLPSDALILDLPQYVSPDGQYLAYYTGTPGDAWDISTGYAADLSLHILRLADGHEVADIPLLSPSYPDNFTQAGSLRVNDPPEGLDGHGQTELAQEFFNAFVFGIFSLDWAPDSTSLAFAGQMQGISSDAYVYDLEGGQVRRLTSGEDQIQRIAWSPDGQWIAHASAPWIGVNPPITNHIVSRDGAVVQSFPNGGELTDGWVTQSWFLVFDANNALGSYNLQVIDAATGRINVIWPDPFRSYAIDTVGQLLLIVALPSPDGSSPEGLFLVDLASSQRARISANPTFFVESLNNTFFPFVAGEWHGGTYLISAAGAMTETDLPASAIWPSPDGSMLAFSSLSSVAHGVGILSVPDLTIQYVTDGYPDSLTWCPDSSCFFFTDHGSLYLLRLSTGEPEFIDSGLAGVSRYNPSVPLFWVAQG